MRITIEPTPARDMKPGDRFRDNGQSVQVTDLEIDEKVVEIIYAFEGERQVNSTFVTPRYRLRPSHRGPGMNCHSADLRPGDVEIECEDS